MPFDTSSGWNSGLPSANGAAGSVGESTRARSEPHSDAVPPSDRHVGVSRAPVGPIGHGVSRMPRTGMPASMNCVKIGL
ncbi:Uncharacterised protein [Mycobacteroides abscessus subsp. abscessus]|nr:Uncharacterised protein [Mycobacteroides abscessus subsp. abscessus]